MWEQLALAAAGSAIDGISGKIFGSKAPSVNKLLEPESEATKRRPTWIRKGAEKAGFNPLTVLKSGAASGPAGQTQLTSPLSTGALVGQALGDAVRNYDPIYEEGRRLDNEYKEMRNATLQSEIDRGVQGLPASSSKNATDAKASTSTPSTGNTETELDRKLQDSGWLTVEQHEKNRTGGTRGQSAEADTVYEAESDFYKSLIDSEGWDWLDTLVKDNSSDTFNNFYQNWRRRFQDKEPTKEDLEEVLRAMSEKHRRQMKKDAMLRNPPINTLGGRFTN